MKYFDYESVAKQAGIPAETLAQWRNLFAREYPNDEMMAELRLLRACDAVRRTEGGLEKVDRALAAEAPADS